MHFIILMCQNGECHQTSSCNALGGHETQASYRVESELCGYGRRSRVRMFPALRGRSSTRCVALANSLSTKLSLNWQISRSCATHDAMNASNGIAEVTVEPIYMTSAA